MNAGPYKGLDFFVEADEELFFGRDHDRKRVISNLTASRLTLLYAQSGVGKSSLLRAGVAARLRRSARPYLPIVHSTWTGDPTAGVLAALRGAAGEAANGDDGDLEKALAHVAASGVLPLLILDQFEDHLRDTSEASERFDDALARCIARSDLRANVLIAVREDAYSGLGDRFKARLPNVYGNFLHLDFLDEDAAREAALLPLEVLNSRLPEGEPHYTLGPGVLDAVLPEVRRGRIGDADGVPNGRPRVETAYLQLVLERLWDSERAANSRVLRIETLERLGGPERIVRAHVDDVLDDLSPSQQDAAAGALGFFVTSSGRKFALTAADASEFSAVPRGTLEPILDHLQDHRILRPVASPEPDGELRREVFHDVLAAPINEWRRRRRIAHLERRNRALLAAVAVLSALTAALMLYVWDPDALRKLELATVDARYQLRPERTPDDIVFVAVDDRDDPAPRRLFARVIDGVDALAPRAIAVDVSFDAGGEPRPGTEELVRSVDSARAPLALAALEYTIERSAEGESRLVPSVLDGTTPIDDRCKGSNGITYGYAGLPQDPDGRTRRLEASTPGGAGTPAACTFAVAVAGLAGATPEDPSLLETARSRAWEDQTHKTAWIDFPGGPGAVQTVDAQDLLNGRVAERTLRDKIVVIGAAAEPEDVLPTPFSSRMRGPEVHAAAIDTVVRGVPLRDVPLAVDIALILLLAVSPLIVLRLRSRRRLPALALAVAVFFLAAAMVAFLAGYVVAVVVPLFALTLAAVLTAVATSVRARTSGQPAAVR